MTEQSVMIEPLNRDNYVSWSEDLKALLLEKDSWSIVKGQEESPPATATAKERKNYQSRVNRGYSTIYLNVSKELRNLISDTENPKIAWETLRDFFQPKSRARLIGLLDTFFSTRPDEGESVGMYAARLRKIIMQVKDAGHELDDMFQSFQLIRYLPAEFSGIIQTIYRWEDKLFKYDAVLKELLCEESRIAQSCSDLEAKNSSIFNTCCKKSNPSKSRNKSKLCTKCGKKNHNTAQCKSKVKSKDFAANSFLIETNLNTTIADSNSWIFDTAASAHFSGDRSLFNTLKPVHDKEMSVAVGEVTYPIEGVGDIKLSFNNGSKTPENVTLLNVMYSPKVNRNLISGSKIDDAKAKFVGCKDKINVYARSGKLLFTAKKLDGLYKCFPKVKSKNNKITLNVNKVKQSDFKTWHRKFCHINSKFLVNTSKNNSVRGLPQFKHFDFKCEECQIAKTKRQSHKAINGPRSRFPLELIHSDLCGPFPVKSFHGHLYFLTFIDDFSRKTTVYPLKDKTQVFECFTRFQKRAERFVNRKIINVRTDNGLEFVHNKFKTFLENQGIRAERSNVYTPQQNGVAERFNFTAADAIKVMLHDSSLNNSFWAEAVLCFTYVWNRVCHSKQSKTPFELYGGQTPSVKHLKIFGSNVFVTVPKQLRNKLDMRAKKGVMVGYAMLTRGYRVWIPAENKIIETSDVRFDDPTKAPTKSGSELEPSQTFTYKFDKSLSSDDESDQDESEHQTKPTETKTTQPAVIQYPTPENMVWYRRAVLRKDKSRVDVYYDLEGSDVTLNSSVKAKNFCKANNLRFDPTFFNFSGANTYTGVVSGNLEVLNVSMLCKPETDI